ncbi:hypothetical protein DFH28DRAFT_1089118 [Melampsora americana]|nr:hypothetical protein DFH28DRAFT_1089118 [Melampsora americana]
MSSQRSLNNLNNHSLLCRNVSRLPSMSSRIRDGRSSSPSNRGPTTRRSPTPTREDLEREAGSPTTSTPANQVPVTTFVLSTARRTLVGGEILFFNTMSMNAGLDPEHHEYAQYLAEPAQHIAISVAQAKTMFAVAKLTDTVGRMSEKLDEVSSMLETHFAAESPSNGPSANAPAAWELIVSLSTRVIVTPGLESYTALEVDRVWLAQSFFSTIRARLNAQPTEWKQQHLPGGSLGIQDSVGTRIHTREKLHLLLLTGIHDPKTGAVVDAPVPNLKLLWHRIANRMGTAGAHADANTLWANTDGPTRARFAYLLAQTNDISASSFYQRREAVRIIQNGRGSSSIWACVDKHLARLRTKGDNYTTCANSVGIAFSFYKIVYDQDKEAFNFKNLFEDLKESCDFALPTDEVVEESMEDENADQE